MSISNHSNAPLDFSLTFCKKGKQNYLKIGFTDQQIKTSEIAGRVFNETTGFFSWIYNVLQNIVSQIRREISFKVIDSNVDVSNAVKVNKFAIESSVFKEAVKNLQDIITDPSPSSDTKALEDIKYSHFIDVFFKPSQQKEALWNKLRPPFSQEIEKNLNRALADPKNWSEIPPSFLASVYYPATLKANVQQILLSQLQQDSMHNPPSQSLTAIRDVFINSFRMALHENDSNKIDKFNDLIKSLPNSLQWINDLLLESFKFAVINGNHQLLGSLLPEITKRCPREIIDILVSNTITDKRVFEQFFNVMISHGTSFSSQQSGQLLEKAIEFGCIDIIQDIINSSFQYTDIDLRYKAFLSALKVKDLEVAGSILKAIQFKEDELHQAIILAIEKKRKDICSLLLNQSDPAEFDNKFLRGLAFVNAVKAGQLDFAKELFKGGEIPSKDLCLACKYSKDNKEILPFLLELFPNEGLPMEVLQSIIDNAFSNNAPSFFLKLYLSNKLTKDQLEVLNKKFKNFIYIQSQKINTIRDNLIDNHRQLNTVLEELSKRAIKYDYPFDCINWSLEEGARFRFYRQALIDFPDKFLEVIRISGLPSKVEFLGEEALDAGGLFRDFIGNLIEGLTKEYSGILDIDSSTGLPQLKDSTDLDPLKQKSRDDYNRFGYFLSQLYDHNLASTQRDGLRANTPCVIGNCFDPSLFILLKVATIEPQKLEGAVKDHINQVLFSKGESLGWAENVPTSKLRLGLGQSLAVFTTREYQNNSQSEKVTLCYEKFLDVQKMLKILNENGTEGDFKSMIDKFSDEFEEVKEAYEKLKSAKDRLSLASSKTSKIELENIQKQITDNFEALSAAVKKTVQKTKEKLIQVYEKEGNPPSTHFVFLDKNPSPDQLILAESLRKGIRFNNASFEEMFGVSLDEKLSNYIGAIKELTLGLKLLDNGLLTDLSSDPIQLSKSLQGEQVSIDSLMDVLILPQDATEDIKTQKEWIRLWLQKDPDNLTKFIKSIGGTNQLPIGKTISLEAKDRVFIHTCFFSMDLYNPLPSQVTKEKFFDRIDETISNTKFTAL